MRMRKTAILEVRNDPIYVRQFTESADAAFLESFEKPASNLFDCVRSVYYVYYIILNDPFLTSRSS